MGKPEISVQYYEDIPGITVSILESKMDGGGFDGYELCLKYGGINSSYDWYSEANITAGEPDFTTIIVEALTTYAVKVCFHFHYFYSTYMQTVHTFPSFAPILHISTPTLLHMAHTWRLIAIPSTITTVLILCCLGASVPQSAKLIAVDNYTVSMTWEPPAKSYGYISSYNIQWTRDAERHGDVRPNTTLSYQFTELQPGQTISAYVRAYSRSDSAPNLEYIGSQSAFLRETTPGPKEGIKREYEGNDLFWIVNEGVVVTTEGVASTHVITTPNRPARGPVMSRLNRPEQIPAVSTSMLPSSQSPITRSKTSASTAASTSTSLTAAAVFIAMVVVLQ
ncbi:Oncosphere antigen A [Echinococcus granulosus]|uniref:Oncosphere antigen A n=1 Tax=Echinococcus granulosus TaxID=6210 RepID=W6UGZ4_ECHGR|nr:Oncosphere antigen A [Echinococcus granulosus]EUB57392.1 Oncosphere antigen A [Echinococcus granulosus]